MGHVPPKKSGGALKWILAGVGCFGLLGLCCFGGFAFLGYQGLKVINNNPAYLEARAQIESSASVGDAVGDPVTVGSYTGVQSNQNGERMTITYDVPVSGPNGSGTAKISVNGKPMTEDWTIESLDITVGGESIPIDGGGLEVNIEE
ncbi:Coa1/Tim21 domain-containing protein [Mariniblastus fucicola]|uniref:Cytochrome oxidase complex assembly protein 1 n=1 Tax=Mariniblastus fucicola TaxID=980251 RepID=A0A5B9P933_9BACT|nr:cytochrome c oxidase assembly factor Coa1 family protein [Mariniblastus fucicola]QEG21400.1 Cytochrome oxidase complex assembly protein 1 [Mariniblastus fucicola]